MILKPSPAITVSEHASIGETIQTLIDHKVGSVVVVSYSPPHKPVGIFTERDLLKWVVNFKNGNQWSTAIGTIMTKKLITLSILELDQANEVMLKNNIRHLPIVYEDKSGEQLLAGIISMRDAFRALVESERKSGKKPRNVADKKITLIAKNLQEKELQIKLLAEYTNLEFIDVDFEKGPNMGRLLKSILSSSVFIFDIDQTPVQFWPALLKTVLQESKHPDIYVIYNPALHERKNIEAIKTIAAGKAVHAFSKPISLIEYLSEVQKSLEHCD